MRASYATVVLGFALALTASACNNNRTAPAEQTKRALDQANIKDVKVDWDKDARVEHLKGTVDSSTERQRAEHVAETAVGTSGTVLNELTVKGMDDKHADNMDSQIGHDLKDMINRDQVLRNRDVKFDVNNGVVTVKGDVRTAAEKENVSQMVKSTPAVKDFANELNIKPKH
jgi:osmotically-inducible protein OsmY